jgi:hypothetical protein
MELTKVNILSAAFAVAMILSPASAALGSTLNYTFSGVASGTITTASNTVTTFTATAFSATFVEDTANITGGGGFLLYNPAGDGTFSEGSYTATFNNAIIEVNGNGDTGSGSFETVFLFNSDFGSSIGISDDPTLLGYDLTTPITTGSIPSSSTFPNPFIGAFQDALGFTTTGGDTVQFTGLDSLDFTVTSPSTSPVPEPSNLGFLAGGGLMLAAIARRKLRQA